MISITKTITQPEEVINAFADDLGYQTVIPNPEYIPAVYEDVTLVELTPAVGEPTIPNPQSRIAFVSDRFDEFVSEKFFGQFAERNARRDAESIIKATVEATKEAVKATITTVVA